MSLVRSAYEALICFIYISSIILGPDHLIYFYLYWGQEHKPGQISLLMSVRNHLSCVNYLHFWKCVFHSHLTNIKFKVHYLINQRTKGAYDMCVGKLSFWKRKRESGMVALVFLGDLSRRILTKWIHCKNISIMADFFF